MVRFIVVKGIFAGATFLCLSATLTMASAPRVIPARPNWQVFWRQFPQAVNKKDRVALRSLMTSERDFCPYCETDTRDEWIEMMFRNGNWEYLRKSVASGTIPFKDSNRTFRITKYRDLIFGVVDGSWRFVGVMGV